MKLNRIFAYLIACIALASALFAYMEYVYMLGFPDGYISELGYAQRMLAYVFIGMSVSLGSYFIYLGWTALRKKISKRLSIAALLYLIFIIGIAVVDYYCRLTLMDSAGG